MYTATNDSGNGPNLFGLIMFAKEPFSTYLLNKKTASKMTFQSLVEFYTPKGKETYSRII